MEGGMEGTWRRYGGDMEGIWRGYGGDMKRLFEQGPTKKLCLVSY